jgi:hypothetical protein
MTVTARSIASTTPIPATFALGLVLLVTLILILPL